MNRKLYKVGRVVLGWIVANFLGVAAIGALFFIYPYLGFVPRRLLPSLCIGLPIGLAQWIALRRIAPISILWVLTIPVGLLLGLVVVNSPLPVMPREFLDDDSVLSLTIVCTIIGLLVGSVQWVFLWRHFTKSLVWPLGSAVGLGLGIALDLASNLIDQSGIGSIILVTLVYAITTGLVISWLPALPRKIESNLVNATGSGQVMIAGKD